MTNQLAIRDEMPVTDIAAAFVKSGYFQDTRDASQAIVKILAGREFGFGAFSSMTGVHIIQGRPSLGANLMAAAVKRSGRYDYRVREMTDTRCSIEFFQREGGKLESIGTSTFGLDDARKAQTKNLDKFPRNMLFARAISNGVRWYTPDVFGTAVYTPEELGADVTENGDVINGSYSTPEPHVVAVTQPAPQPLTLDSAREMRTPKGTRLGDLTVEQLEQVAARGKGDLHDAAELLLAVAEAADEAARTDGVEYES